MEENWNLSDVPEAHLDDVRSLLRTLPVPHTETTPTWGLVDMRGWLETLSHYHSFSKAVVLQICRVIAWCLSAPREKGEEPSREGFQRAFIRQGGFKSLIQVLLQRLNDPEVVAASVQVSAAAIHNSPLAAEALHADGEKNVRLLMRAIERHAADGSVAKQGCHLMSNLCAFGAEVQDTHELRSIRPRGHRESQDLLMATGAVELAINILKASVQKLEKLYQTRDELIASTELAKQAVATLDIADPRRAKYVTGADEGPLNRIKKKIEEQTPFLAGVQGAALQALVLMCLGNSSVTRVVVGTFRSEELVRREEQEEKDRKQREKQAEEAAARLKRKGKGKGKGPKGAVQTEEEDEEPVDDGLPTGEARYSLTTLEGFAAALAPVADVLRGKAAYQRAELAAQAARLLVVLTEHQASVLKHLARQSEVEDMDQLSRIGRAPEEERHPSEPFAALVPVASSGTAMLRQHGEDVQVLVAVVGALVKLREVALLAAPGGVSPHSPVLHKAWCSFLAGVEVDGELRNSEDKLSIVLHHADVIKRNGLSPSQACGEGIVTLTPRLERAARQAYQDVHALAGEALTEHWRAGAPTRGLTAESLARTEVSSDPSSGSPRSRKRMPLTRRTTTRNSVISLASHGQQSMVMTPRSKAAARQTQFGVDPLHGGDSTDMIAGMQRTSSTQSLGQMSAGQVSNASRSHHPRATRMGGALSVKSTRKGGGGGRQSSAVTSLMEPLVEAEELTPLSPTGWRRALGWKHDEEDFNDLFKGRIADVMSRNFTAPSFLASPPEAPQADGDAESHDLQLLAGVSSSMESSTRDVPTSLETQFVESEDGVLRARVIVETEGNVHRTWSKLRLRELEDPAQTAKAVTASLSKELRKDGYMLPTRGIQVVVKRAPRSVARQGGLSTLAPMILGKGTSGKPQMPPPTGGIRRPSAASNRGSRRPSAV